MCACSAMSEAAIGPSDQPRGPPLARTLTATGTDPPKSAARKTVPYEPEPSTLGDLASDSCRPEEAAARRARSRGREPSKLARLNSGQRRGGGGGAFAVPPDEDTASTFAASAATVAVWRGGVSHFASQPTSKLR